MQRIVTLLRFDGGVYAVDTVLFRPGTLAPVWNVEWVAGTLAWRRQYSGDGKRVTGQRLMAAEGSGMGGPESAARNLDVRLGQSVFDLFGGMDGLIAASISHREGETTCVRNYMASGDSAGVLALRVLRKERVEAGAGRFAEAYVVETDGENGPQRFWVTKTPPFVLKSEEVMLKDGKPWRIYTTLMLDGPV